MKIWIDLADRSLSGTLDDSAPARDFASLLPLALRLKDYERTEKISDLHIAPLREDGVTHGTPTCELRRWTPVSSHPTPSVSASGKDACGRVRHLPRLSARVVFVVAACSFVVAGSPIPLYNTYRAQDGITNADLGIVSVGYFVAAATALLAHAPQTHRAGLLSTIYLISYSGAAIPAMIAGKAAAAVSLLHIAFGYAALGIVASGTALACARNPKR